MPSHSTTPRGNDNLEFWLPFLYFFINSSIKHIWMNNLLLNFAYFWVLLNNCIQLNSCNFLLACNPKVMKFAWAADRGCSLIFLSCMIFHSVMMLLFKIISMQPLFTAALFTKTKGWKQPKCSSTGDWINKMWSIHTIEYYFALKRKEFLTSSIIGMHTEEMLSEINPSHKDKFVIPVT